jgi:hypothetical protein
MSYLEKALKFLTKNYLLALPILVALVIPALMVENATAGATSNFMDNFETMQELAENMEDLQYYSDDVMDLYEYMFEDVFGDIWGIAQAAMMASFIGFILNFIARPMTYGLVNRGLATGSVKIQDAGNGLGENLVKYLLFLIGQAVLWLLIGIASIIAFILIAMIAARLGGIGFIIILICILALVAFGIFVSVITNLWFPAMVVEDLGVIEGLKKAFTVGKAKFWTLLGVGLLVWLASVIGGFIFGFFTGIPFLGTIIGTLVPTVVAFVMIAFCLVLYRDHIGADVVEAQAPVVEPENYNM